MNKTDKDPTAYIDSLPDDRRSALRALDALISEVMVGQPRVLWEGTFWGGSEQSIIGYGDYSTTQSRGKKVEWFMVGLALQKNYISLYVNAVQDRQYVAEKFKGRLGKVKVGKASISFSRIEDLNMDALTEVLAIARGQLTPAEPSR